MSSPWVRRVGIGALVVLVALVARSAAGDSGEARRAALPAVVPAEYLEEIPADTWLNVDGNPPTAASLKGNVVLVEFWTYLCYNCVNVEPWMKKTHAEFADRGLRVIGIHTPEFEVEKEIENVRAYTKEKDIVWPVAIDNDFRVWRKYNETHAWPAFLVYDRDGRLIYRRAGERAVHGARDAIEKALAVPATEARNKRNKQTERGAGAGADGEGTVGDAEGIVLEARPTRLADGRPAVAVKLEARPGFRLVRSPASEIRLTSADGTTAEAELGDPFEGGDIEAVTYWEGPAEISIPAAADEAADGATEPVTLSVHYRVCDDERGVCSSHEASVPVHRGS